MATGDDGGSCGANIVDDEEVLAFQRNLLAVVGSGIVRRLVGGAEFEDAGYVFLSSPTILVGLTLFERGSSHDVGMYGEMGEFCDTFGDFLALVVTSLFLSVLGERNGDDAIDVVEEMDSRALLCQESSHVEGNVGAVVVFQLIEDVAGEGVSLVIEECARFLDGNLMPKHLRHLVVVGLLPSVGSGEMEIARETDSLFLACQSIPTDGAEARK